MTAFSSKLVASGGLPGWLSDDHKKAFAYGWIKFQTDSSDFIWNKLPNISIEVASSEGGTFQLVIGPYQYIQQDQDGSWMCIFAQGSDEFVMLGLPLFTMFYISINYDSGLIGFAPGCPCTYF